MSIARRRMSPALKRLIDVLVSGLGYVVEPRIMGADAMAVRRDPGSPVLFLQQLPRLHGKRFAR